MYVSIVVENNEIVCIFSYWNEINLFVLSILKIYLFIFVWFYVKYFLILFSRYFFLYFVFVDCNLCMYV